MKMAVFNLKMAFGILILFTSSTNFISGKPSGPALSSDVNKELKNFIEFVKTRVALGKDVAEYKFIIGQPLVVEEREKEFLDSAKKTAEEMGFKYSSEDQLFFVEVMEATKFYGSVLLSDWSGASKTVTVPKAHGDITVIRGKISEMQKGLVKFLYGLKTIREANDCQSTVAKAIGESQKAGDLLTFAVQRAFGSYCKVTMSHK